MFVGDLLHRTSGILWVGVVSRRTVAPRGARTCYPHDVERGGRWVGGWVGGLTLAVFQSFSRQSADTQVSDLCRPRVVYYKLFTYGGST